MPTLPTAPRIPYNIASIGASVISWTTTGATSKEADQAGLDILCGESDGAYWEGAGGVTAILMPPFDLHGAFMSRTISAFPGVLQYSTDTTNGIDGSWVTTNFGSINDESDTRAAYREDLWIASPIVENIKAVRSFQDSSDSLSYARWYAFHIYGYLRGTDRLELWDPTLDQRLAGDHFDLGAYARGGSAVDVDFRIKNLSGTKQANSISLSVYTDHEPATAPTVLSWHQLADDGVTFGAGPIAVGNLAAGAISSVMTLRRQPLIDASLGYWSGKLLAAPTSWS